jgi:hypothetical protein
MDDGEINQRPGKAPGVRALIYPLVRLILDCGHALNIYYLFIIERENLFVAVQIPQNNDGTC